MTLSSRCQKMRDNMKIRSKARSGETAPPHATPDKSTVGVAVWKQAKRSATFAAKAVSFAAKAVWGLYLGFIWVLVVAVAVLFLLEGVWWPLLALAGWLTWLYLRQRLIAAAKTKWHARRGAPKHDADTAILHPPCGCPPSPLSGHSEQSNLDE